MSAEPVETVTSVRDVVPVPDAKRCITLAGGFDRCTEPKRKGSPRYCEEDWLAGQPMQEQIAAADARLAAVPPDLRVARIPKEAWPAGRRWCAGCQSFVRLSDCASGASRCRPCVARTGREYRLGRDYGITTREYKAIWLAQGGVCYLCGKRSISRPLATDHNHETGEVRGLLCPDPDWGCNLKIVARAESSPGGIVGYALRLLVYGRNPPARAVLAAIREKENA
jgi:hypothetical protein